MDDLKVNNALNLIDHLLFTSSWFLKKEDMKEYQEAFDTIVNYIRTYQTRIDDDWK